MSSLTPTYPDTVHYRGLNRPTHIEGSAHDLYVEGVLPAEIDGAFFRAVHDPAHVPMNHDDVVLSRDGMVSKIEFRGGRASCGVRYVRTERFLAERKAGRSLFGGYRNPYLDDPSVRGLDRTVANTTPYYHAGRLYMSKEDGLPYRIDPATLETLGRWDYQGKVRSETLSAHPKIDPVTGELFLFGYEADGLAGTQVAYYVFDPDGTIIHEHWFDVPFCAMQHDFAVTEQHAIFMLYPTTADLERMKQGGPHWIHHQDQAALVGVMPRYGSPDEMVWFEGPKGVLAFHVLNAFTQGSQITLDQCLFNTNFFPFVMQASGIDMQVDGALTRWTMDLADPAAGVSERKLGPLCEMPMIAHADLGRAYSRGWYLTVDPTKVTMLANGPGEILFNCLHRVSLPGGEVELFSDGPGIGFNEPVHIPAEDPDHGGWLMMMVDRVIAEDHWVQEVWILEADAVSKGPVAKVKMPFSTCEQVHGNWVPRRLLDQARAD